MSKNRQKTMMMAKEKKGSMARNEAEIRLLRKIALKLKNEIVNKDWNVDLTCPG